MKFSLCLLLAFCSLSLAGTAQKITINLKNSPLVNALTLIEGQSNYSFAYKKDLLQKAKIVSLSIKNKSLKESLDELFRDQPFDYKIYENHIVLILKEVNDKRKMPARLHEEVQQNLSGRVVDSLGAAIIGATVDNVTAKSKTATDAAGNFSLSGKIGDVIQVSYIGYKTITTKVEKINNISITLSTDDNAIEDVVITALGIKRSSRSLTYNVQEVQGSELRENKDANFMNALAGKVAGVTINASTSGIGGSSRVIMRGTKSLSNNNGALYVVDGIPLPSMGQGQSNGLFDGSDGGEGISMFNPDDIESLSLLTGPASSALYGGDAANGVVLITTKKGTSDRFRLDYSNHTSLFNPFVTPKFQTKYGNNPGIFSSWGPELLNPSSYDPLDFFQTGYNNSNSLTMSSGTETSQTYFSIGTVNAGGIIPNNKFNRYNILARNTSSFFDDKLTLDVNAWYINQNG